MTYTQKLQQRAKKNLKTKVIKDFSLYEVILSPLVTEKTHKQQEAENKYCFKVHKNANKNDIKAAIACLYKVVPQKINVVNVPFKGRSGRKLVRHEHKKAVITLSKKDKIEIL